MSLGISGKLTRATIQLPLTPLFLLAAIIVGLIATISIPREEEPQIKVPMVDIRVGAPGLSAADSVELVAKPLESIVKSIDGVDHVYTQAQDHGVMVTARFAVGQDPEAAATRIDEKIKANIERIPAGVAPPQITVRGISDVPIVVLTLTPKPGAQGQSAERWNDRALYDLATKLRSEVAKVDDVGITFLAGGQREAIRVIPDPARLAAARVPLSSVMEAIGQGGRSFPAGTVREGGQALAITAGLPLAGVPVVLAMFGLGMVAGNVNMVIDASDVKIPINEAIPCGLIVNELVSNALKHGFAGHRQGSIWVSLMRDADDHVELSVANDGAGIPDEQNIDRAGSLGLQLVHLLTRQLRGRLEVQRREPTRFSLRCHLSKTP